MAKSKEERIVAENEGDPVEERRQAIASVSEGIRILLTMGYSRQAVADMLGRFIDVIGEESGRN